jgi:cleavage and polyadenylation specificity factor subunit 3
VGKDFDYQIVHPDDLPEQANTKTFALRQRLSLSTRATLSLLEHILAALVGQSAVQRLGKDQVGFLIKGAFELIQDKSNPTSYILSWEGGILNDIVADSIIAVILNAEVSPASVKVSSNKCNHSNDSNPHCHESDEHPADILASFTADSARIKNIIKAYLEGYFGAIDEEDAHYTFSMDSIPVRVSMNDFSVDCEEGDVRDKVIHLLDKLSSLLSIDIVI